MSSLAQPGGNITGLTFLGPELLPKRLSLLKEALPAVSRVVGLWHPDAYGERTMGEMMRDADGAARSRMITSRMNHSWRNTSPYEFQDSALSM